MESINGRLSASPAHWSKDFVEHLRTIHFTLLGVSVGLILIAFSTKTYSSTAALREIDQILELRRVWSPDWIWRNGEKKQKQKRHILGFEDGRPVNKAEFLGRARWAGPNEREAIFRFLLPNRNWLVDSSAVGEDQAFVDMFPDTLSGFATWWEALGPTRDVLFLEGVAHDGEVYQDAKFNRHLGLISFEGPQLNKLATTGGTTTVHLGITASYLSDGSVVTHYVASDDNGHYFIVYPDSAYDVGLDQNTFVKYFKNWRGGSFDSAFEDLTQAAREFRSLQLSEVQKIVSDDAAKGTEVFEALGMKFPAGQITLWGSAVLLGVQLYFLLYLKQFSGKLSAGDPGWDVPWIGMNGSTMAQCVLFATIVVIPVAALGSLTAHFVSAPSFRQGFSPQSIAEVVVLLCGSLIGIVLSALCWKYRPRLA